MTLDELELVEKQSLRTVVQALQQYSREAKDIFETTKAVSDQEVIVLGEDLVQYALEVAEVFAIDKRFAGFIDYKRCRWLPTVYGTLPQVLLVDAKASTENNRETLQQSQLPMRAEWELSRGTRRGQSASLDPGVPAHHDIRAYSGNLLHAVTTTMFVHWHYSKTPQPGKERELLSIFAFCAPHASLKPRYNPTPYVTIFGEGKHSPGRNEEPRVRVYYSKLRRAMPWRLQELKYVANQNHALASWRDVDTNGIETNEPFEFILR